MPLPARLSAMSRPRPRLPPVTRAIFVFCSIFVENFDSAKIIAAGVTLFARIKRRNSGLPAEEVGAMRHLLKAGQQAISEISQSVCFSSIFASFTTLPLISDIVVLPVVSFSTLFG